MGGGARYSAVPSNSSSIAQLTTTVSPNASTSLTDALSVGDAAYDPYSSVMIYYATARQQVTTNDYVLATLLPIVERILAQAGIAHTASFLGNVADNSTALSTSLICPQCLATPFSFTEVDLIPFSKLQSTYTVTSLLIYVRCCLCHFIFYFFAFTHTCIHHLLLTQMILMFSLFSVTWFSINSPTTDSCLRLFRFSHPSREHGSNWFFSEPALHPLISVYRWSMHIHDHGSYIFTHQSRFRGTDGWVF
jgi:hypothetical protein